MKNRFVAVGSTLMLGAFLITSDSPSGLASRTHGATGVEQTACEFSVSPTRIMVEAPGQTGVIRVDTQPGCAWTARLAADVSWMRLTGAAGGTGSGTIEYLVAPYTSQEPRQVKILVRWDTPTAGQNVLVTQTNGPCGASLALRGTYAAPISVETFGGVAGASTVEIVTRDGLNWWFFVSAPDWITFTHPPLGLLGFSDHVTTFSVAANPRATPRDGTIVFCNGAMNVHQAGASLMGSPFVQTDFDGDGISDLAVYRPPSGQSASGEWFVLQSHSGYSYADALRFEWGGPPTLAGLPDVPVPADFDGDGRTELAVYSVGLSPRGLERFWKLRYSSNEYSAATATSRPWGDVIPGASHLDDVPLRADFNGDRKADFVVYDRFRVWRVLYTNAGLGEYFNPDGGAQWGIPGDVPVPADFDGDGKAELAVWRPSNGTWYIRDSSDNYRQSTARTYQWGLPGDVPVIADFDADRRADLAVWRPSNGIWYVVFSSNGYNTATAATYPWGLSGDVPMANDFDGDGRTDPAVWRPSTGTWYLLLSSGNYSYATSKAYQWGLPGDIPLGKR